MNSPGGWDFSCRRRSRASTVDKLYRDSARIVQLPDVKQKLQLDAAEPVGSTPEQFTRHLRAEVARWTQVVKAAGIKVE